MVAKLIKDKLKLLRIELERFRAMEKFHLAVIDRIMDSRDQWQREAKRLSALMAQVPSLALSAPRALLFR